ncbi:MAG: hypothetical protein WCS72_19480 [Deltaproteobacteria bacterium]
MTFGVTPGMERTAASALGRRRASSTRAVSGMTLKAGLSTADARS